MKLCVLLFILSSHVVYSLRLSQCRVTKNPIYTNTILGMSPTSNLLTTTTISSGQTEETLRKWFLLKYQKRCEVNLIESTSTQQDFIVDIWKAILISYRVLKNDETNKKYTALYAFPNINLQKDGDKSSIQALETNLNERLQGLRLLLQPEFQYSVSFAVANGDGNDSSGPTLPLGLPFVLIIDTESMKPEPITMDDIEKMLPNFESTLTNSIPSFPFPSVYDFVSEINRPVDPATLASLRFNFQIRDLKFDVEKMKKKNKNPQDYVDNINCRLTRLAKWRDVLSDAKDDMPDPFSDAEWGQRVRSKYQSLLVQARRDPKYALDNQYNKRATFIKIIDDWSLRLKQSFKFIYESKRLPPQDFMAPILASKWRAQVMQLTALPAQVAFLDLDGPAFKPGEPKVIIIRNH